MAEVERKWERIEEAYKPTLVMGVYRLKCYNLTLGRLNEDQTPPQRQLRSQIKYVIY